MGRSRSQWYILLSLCGTLVTICALSMTPIVSSAQPVTIVIDRPTTGETIHSNTGTVPVAVSLPGRTIVAGERLRVLIEGKPYGADQPAMTFELQGIERGEHSLHVQLIDAKGATLATSRNVTFYLWQASSLFPGRKPETHQNK